MWEKEKKAFREGKRIQIRKSLTGVKNMNWYDIFNPEFLEYRIHPEDLETITEWHDKLVVHCKTKEQMEKVVELQPKKKGFLGQWGIYNTKTCITNDGFYCSKEFYKQQGNEVIKAKEFLKRYKPKKKEIGKEPLNEGDWAAFWDRYDNFYTVSKYKRLTKTHEIFHDSSNTTWEFALPISVGHEAILKAMEETNKK